MQELQNEALGGDECGNIEAKTDRETRIDVMFGVGIIKGASQTITPE